MLGRYVSGSHCVGVAVVGARVRRVPHILVAVGGVCGSVSTARFPAVLGAVGTLVDLLARGL